MYIHYPWIQVDLFDVHVTKVNSPVKRKKGRSESSGGESKKAFVLYSYETPQKNNSIFKVKKLSIKNFIMRMKIWKKKKTALLMKSLIWRILSSIFFSFIIFLLPAIFFKFMWWYYDYWQIYKPLQKAKKRHIDGHLFLPDPKEVNNFPDRECIRYDVKLY